jgi:hypothetical protein
MPVRITVSERSLKQGGVEFKPRVANEATVIPIKEVIDQTRQATMAPGDGDHTTSDALSKTQ